MMVQHSPLMPVHIAGGATAIISGFVALYAAKGNNVHRKSGMVFVYAMFVMALTGAGIAAVRGSEGVAIGGAMTAYFVITALNTVRPIPGWSPRLDLGLMLVVVIASLTNFAWGIEAATSPTHTREGLPSFPFFMWGIIGSLAAVGDARMIRAGGLRGASRLARHLWRMCWAMWVATGSFFLGQAKVIPKPIRIFPVLAIPPLIVVVALVYWLWRVRWRQSLRGIVVAGARDTREIAERRFAAAG